MECRNIASTHSLFSLIDEEAMGLIKAGNYVLIMDEVMTVLEELRYPPKKVEAMFRREILSLEDPESFGNGTIAKVRPGAEKHLDEFETVQRMAAADRLIFVNDTVLMWLFPAHIFDCFAGVYNLGYLFEGQLQKSYYDMHGLSYEMLSIRDKADSGRYSLIPYDPSLDRKIIRSIRDHIMIYEGTLNRIGEPVSGSNPLSKSWYKNNPKAREVLKKAVYNFFNNIVKGRVSLI